MLAVKSVHTQIVPNKNRVKIKKKIERKKRCETI